MVPKSGTRLPKSQILLSEAEFARAIGQSLRIELGASHRAAKTIMAWTGVSGRTARLWLNGASSPNGRHLVVLATHCRSVLVTVLRLSGHDKIILAIDLETMEAGLEALLESVRQLRAKER